MKHLTMWLTVLLLGGLPLAAAALDYGPNRQLLAAENGGPQQPGALPQLASPAAVPKPDIGQASASETPGPGVTASRETLSRSLPVASRSTGSTASNKPRRSAPPKPVDQLDPASWRSLLPGSIQ